MLAPGVAVGFSQHEITDIEEGRGNLLLVAKQADHTGALHHEEQGRGARGNGYIGRAVKGAERNDTGGGGISLVGGDEAGE